MKYVLVTGAPGSKWSSVVKNIYFSPSIDRSDYGDERTYYHDADEGVLKLMHLGAYYDPGMEFGDWFDRLDHFSKEECELIKNFGIFNYVGGVKLVPEFLALLFSLSLYTSAFIAENVRAGILAISKGQKEASKSLGFNNPQTLKLIVIPQALRVIIPPTTNQYLNLTKNSSLAAAIGYPDLAGVFAGTALSQTGKAIEIIFMVMMTYLTISLIISGILNWYNKKIAIVER